MPSPKWLLAVAAACLCTAFWMLAAPPPVTGATTDVDVTDIEQIGYDGTTLSVVYGVQSTCTDPKLHSTGVRLEPLRYPQRGWQVILTDRETRTCGGSYQYVRLAEQLNLRTVIDRERRGQKGPFTLLLPAVLFTHGVPTTWTPIPQSPQTGEPGPSVSVGGIKTTWHCALFKRDGARDDGFTAQNPNLADARNAAADACKRTGNAFCDTWSKDPTHTSCIVLYTDSDGKLLPHVEWTCKLRKNDGSRRDGFDGKGFTEHEARNAAAVACRSTKNPHCYNYSMDNNHTTCDMTLVE